MALRSVFLLFCWMLLSLPFSLSGQMQKQRKITIKATNSFAYCGGVDPGEEAIRQMTMPVPMKNTMLFVRKGSFNDVNSKIVGAGKTDTSGQVVFSLDTGTYVVISKAKLDKKLYNEYIKRYKYKTEQYGPADKVCLEKWLKEPLTIIHVGESGPALFTFNMHVGCNWEGPPCVQYYGSPPP